MSQAFNRVSLSFHVNKETISHLMFDRSASSPKKPREEIWIAIKFQQGSGNYWSTAVWFEYISPLLWIWNDDDVDEKTISTENWCSCEKLFAARSIIDAKLSCDFHSKIISSVVCNFHQKTFWYVTFVQQISRWKSTRTLINCNSHGCPPTPPTQRLRIHCDRVGNFNYVRSEHLHAASLICFPTQLT